MNVAPDLAAVATLIADPSRAAMLSALLGGVALPAGELAHHARISPQTASVHLAKLVQGGLLRVTTSGRHRYFCLRDQQVAQVLESLALLAPPLRVRGLSDSLERQKLCHARFCYDHLAGALGVGLTHALVDRGVLLCHSDVYEVTDQGERWFATFGIDCAALAKQRRMFAVGCLDWSERKPHLAGALGAALAQRLCALGWLTRVAGSRAVHITATGRAHLAHELDLHLT